MNASLIRVMIVALVCAGLGVAGTIAGCDGRNATETIEHLELELSQIADGFSRPIHVTSAGDGSGRLFVTEQTGAIRIIDPDGQVLPEPFLDLSGVVNPTGEAGLLSVAFHPDYSNNGRLFVNFVSDREGIARSYVSEFEVDPEDPNRVQAGSERVLFSVDQATYYHNGGLLLFGPDGYLWCGLGDGHGPPEVAQDNSNLLGALLRIDVDNGDPYGIPNDNPFVDDAQARDEIYAYGFRNPWRFSIDHETGRIFVADVGADDWEEVNLVEAGGNYGWPMMEGTHCYPPGTDCDPTGLELPIYEYTIRDVEHCAIIGGEVYRGERYPGLEGVYFFGDWCSGVIWSLLERDGEWEAQTQLDSNLRISSFGLDEDGEMYVVDLEGGVYRMDFHQPEDN